MSPTSCHPCGVTCLCRCVCSRSTPTCAPSRNPSLLPQTSILTTTGLASTTSYASPSGPRRWLGILVCVCVSVLCVWVCGCACVCLSVWVSVGVGVCMCMCVSICVGVGVGAHTYVCAYACACVCVCVCGCVCEQCLLAHSLRLKEIGEGARAILHRSVHTHTHTHAHAHTQARTHARTHTRWPYAHTQTQLDEVNVNGMVAPKTYTLQRNAGATQGPVKTSINVTQPIRSFTDQVCVCVCVVVGI